MGEKQFALMMTQRAALTEESNNRYQTQRIPRQHHANQKNYCSRNDRHDPEKWTGLAIFPFREKPFRIEHGKASRHQYQRQAQAKTDQQQKAKPRAAYRHRGQQQHQGRRAGNQSAAGTERDQALHGNLTFHYMAMRMAVVSVRQSTVGVAMSVIVRVAVSSLLMRVGMRDSRYRLVRMRMSVAM